MALLPPKPRRLLIVLPSWVGDAVMATPTLARIRRALPGAFIGALARPGIDELLAGSELIDEFHVGRSSGVMGPKFIAAKLRPRQYDTALLLTNSFSTALVVRVAGIPRRVGYDRDARGLLLTDRIEPPRAGVLTHAVVPACTYYWRAGDALLGEHTAIPDPFSLPLPSGEVMRLGTTPREEELGELILARAGLIPGERFALLNPGGNNPAKRWPAERFAALADFLMDHYAMRSLVNGSPGEAELCSSIAGMATVSQPQPLPQLGITLGALKAITRRAGLMVTNDTGPRHIAAAFGVPVVSLFGPTDARWTVIPTHPGGPEAVLTADPTLPAGEVANDHPERCAIDRITLERVRGACARVLGAPAH